MFCPRCGSNQTEEQRFCKLCGANLSAVRRAIDTRETDEKPDRSKPWFAEMSLSDAESKRRQVELDHRRGITPEIRRHNEIKGGVITGSIGLALAIFLNVFMQGLVSSGKIPPDVAEILSRLWVVGVIPLFVGIALIINGVFVSKRLAEIARRAAQTGSSIPETNANPLVSHSVETNELIPSGFSVTEEATEHLKSHEHHQ